jgi:hypothetical protein
MIRVPLPALTLVILAAGVAGCGEKALDLGDGNSEKDAGEAATAGGSGGQGAYAGFAGTPDGPGGHAGHGGLGGDGGQGGDPFDAGVGCPQQVISSTQCTSAQAWLDLALSVCADIEALTLSAPCPGGFLGVEYVCCDGT